MHLKLLDEKPRKEDEAFQNIIKKLEKCDSFVAVSLYKNKNGTLYKRHFFKIKSEEVVYASELLKIEEIRGED